MKQEVDDKRRSLNEQSLLLQKEQSSLHKEKAKMKTEIDKKVKAETERATEKLNETYEKRWNRKRHYLNSLLVYGGMVTLLEASESKLFISEIITFLKTAINAFCFLAGKDYEIAKRIAKISEHISNRRFENIAYGMIILLICGLSIVALVLGIKLLAGKVIDYYKDSSLNYVSVTALVVNMAVMIFAGDKIKVYVPANLLLVLIVIQVVCEAVISYVDGCKRARNYW
ncbi:MAG: DUF6040 family protein [Eubacterium sp.]|jgi:hypothetical protein|nr:DUF6040 family protein [Eubacterium sp.]